MLGLQPVGEGEQAAGPVAGGFGGGDLEVGEVCWRGRGTVGEGGFVGDEGGAGDGAGEFGCGCGLCERVLGDGGGGWAEGL